MIRTEHPSYRPAVRGQPYEETGTFVRIKHALGRVTAVAAAAAGLAAVGLTGAAYGSTSSVAAAADIPFAVCTIQSFDGHYLSAVGGGGRTTDVIHSNATQASTWETFTFVYSGDGASPFHYGIETSNGNFLTAVGGGGRTTDVIHSNATLLQSWEKFTLVPVAQGWYAFRTIDGHYLTAVDSGGRTTDVIHSNATQIQAWEEFYISCNHG